MAKKLFSFFKLPETTGRFLLHLLTWLLVWATIRYFSVPTLTKDNLATIEHAAVAVMSQTLIIFYFLGYIVFPKFLYPRRLIPFIISLLALFQLIYITNYYEFSYLAQISNFKGQLESNYIVRAWNRYLNPNPWTVCFTDFKIAYFNYGWSFFYVTPVLVIKVMRDVVSARTHNLRLERDRIQLEKDNLDLQRQRLTLQRDNLNLELSFLKSQINPHFLFNTLNAIYARTADVDEHAADLVMRLSNLMRYSLYESNRERVVMTKEVDYIESYIELEKARFSDKVAIDYQLHGNPEHYFIAPLLLISFVENAFKHGTSRSLSSSFVNISIHLEDAKLLFSVKNSVPPKNKSLDSLKQTGQKPGGFGLVNTAKRLALLYPQKHKLDIIETDQQFEINLEMELTSVSHLQADTQL
ncbi:sensor histidine kinase [Dyadobacter pollutisoli]|uniref:Histidine kinase n=1 Tax=Dyadobacter pollutisoli TaxID=2910158 RepID=A0A9E8SMC6_9BACT|nr:histidine kinase [Dyadobacter pollutisoli]WAC13983.1 histidine kinase [Dyadobacter pollutisoli]